MNKKPIAFHHQQPVIRARRPNPLALILFFPFIALAYVIFVIPEGVINWLQNLIHRRRGGMSHEPKR